MLNGPEAFSLTRSLTVEGVVVSGPDGSTYEECDAIGPYGEICFWDTDQNSAETLNWIVRMILKKFSKGQLRKFEWLHDAPLLTETLLFLESTQVESLRELIVTHYYDDGEGLGNDPNNFNKLESLEFREDDLAISFIAYLYRENIQSLRHFAIGRNHSIARLYTDDGRPDSNDADSQYDAMREFLDYDTRVDFGKSVLESLAICGFDVQPSLNEKHTGLFNYEKLTSLRLESCVGSNELLRSLASQNKSASQFPKDSFLKEFTFRYEKPTGHTRSALSDFLKSFSGLRKLFVLLDETTIMPSLDCFTQTHGRTLTALLWDGRVGPRPGWTGSNTANMSFLPGAEFKNAFHFVTSKCPNLVELGFPFDWEYGVSVSSL
ncbi:MAG: mitochondrial splicing system protein [Trizodia sp. TS-e1964]|nr:MAG: mitochondrial splicing system protein [Trizodia sp. TS-e1964]